MFISIKNYKRNAILKLLYLLPFIFSMRMAYSQDSGSYYFPLSLISLDTEQVADLSSFELQGAQMPGTYDVDIYLNGNIKFRRYIKFFKENECQEQDKNIHAPTLSADKTGLLPLLTRDDLAELGVNIDNIPSMQYEDNRCINVSQLIPNSYTEFDFQKMKLEINIPQVSLKNLAKDEIPISQWNNGVSTLFTNYSFGATDSQYHHGFSKNINLNLRNGINLESWRYRDNRTWTRNQSKVKKKDNWQHLNSYIERGVIPWRSRLIFGDSSTNNTVFDSISFRGAQLRTDESMYPVSQQGFSPIIRGVANSNATIEIRQNNYLIYQSNIPSGEFAISDLNALNSNGDLHVSVIEANGNIQSFIVPYSSVPVLLREGRINYSLTMGDYRSDNDNYNAPQFSEGTLEWGLSSRTTIYGGFQYAENYIAGSVGSGFNLGHWGAISSDITHANSQLADGSRHQGQSLRFLYAKAFPEIGTNLQLTGYRYSTQGYYSLQETSLKRMAGWLSQNDILDVDGESSRNNTDYFNLYDNKRDKLQANISKKIDGIGSIYFSGVRKSFWERDGSSISIQAGLSSQISNINYTITYGLDKNINQHYRTTTDRNLFLSVSIPLQKWLPQDTPAIYASYSANSANSANQKELIQQTSLSGSLLSQQNLNWNVAQGYSSNGGNDGNLSLAYNGGYGNTQVGYSYGKDYRKISTGVSGGITLHPNGMVFSQPLGETNILVAAPGASDIPVENTIGVRTDWFGYTIKPYATPYRLNRIALDSSKLDEKTEIENSIVTTVPTRGAIVQATFVTRHGTRALVRMMKDGKNLPFGSIVSIEHQAAIVGDDGQVYLSGLTRSGELVAKWGYDDENMCRATYILPENTNRQSLVRFNVNCK